jgi:hypothetical protein
MAEKADLTTVRKFFEEGGQKISAAELMALKKDKDADEKLPDYDQIAMGIGDGTLNYEPTEEQIKRAQARQIPVPIGITL